MNVVYLILLSLISTYKLNSKHKKEILTTNNLDQVYQTKLQKEGNLNQEESLGEGQPTN